MNAHPKLHLAATFILLILFGINSPLYAQVSNAPEEPQQYEELVKYQTNHIIEQDKEAQSFSETMTGLGTQMPEDVFLASLNVVEEDPENLKKALIHKAISEDVPVGEFEFVEYDDLFAGSDDGSGSGFGVGVSGGHCPPGSYNF